MDVTSSELHVVRRFQAFWGRAEKIDDDGPLVFSLGVYFWLVETP